jgi:Xaa-Pro aminopeptidase
VSEPGNKAGDAKSTAGSGTANGKQPDGTRTHDPLISEALHEFMTTGWAPEEEASGGPLEVAGWAAKRRAKLSESFPGERLVIPSGPLKVRNNDVDFRFRPHSDYVWLTGAQDSDAVLVLEPTGSQGHDAILFYRPRQPRSESMEFWRNGRYGEFWVGRRPTLAELTAAYGLRTQHIDELAGLLESGSVPTRVSRGVDPSVDTLVAARDDDGAADKELRSRLSVLRLVKDAYEIEELQLAVDITIRGFEDCVRELRHAIALGDQSGRSGPSGERWLEGTFWRRARLEGNDVGYYSIVGGGSHATTLHWIRDDGPIRSGELLLMDMGVETRGLYTADVTRTYPISGTWTSLQKDLYSLELAAADAGIAEVKPGNPFKAYHQAAMRVMAHGLADLGLLPCSAEEALDENSQVYRRWTLHGSGHMLGLDVHDCSASPKEAYTEGTLEPGHVLTVEPGLYFQPSDLLAPAEVRGMGFRIEDDLLVTEDGADVMSAGLPRDPDQIETWMGTLSA